MHVGFDVKVKCSKFTAGTDQALNKWKQSRWEQFSLIVSHKGSELTTPQGM